MTALLGLVLALLGSLVLVAGLVLWLLEREFRAAEAFWGEENAD